jgi:hypothetical protein
MNAVEIEEAVSDLVAQPFDAQEFPFQFLAAFAAKDTTLKRLRKGESNASDVVGGVLQRNNIHIAVARPGEVGGALATVRASSKTASAKAKFLLATDGETVEAEDLASGEVLACAYVDLPHHFGLFLPLAGISTVKEIKNNPIDVKATGRLNRLYVELLKDNPDWATEARRHELNQFMARLIFCFFAEDTGIFREGSFTATVTQMSHAGHGSGEDRWGNTHEVLQHLFLAMDTPVKHEGKFDDRHRRAANIRPWADVFPYVNGGMFDGARECPRFSRTARAYLLRAGELDWKEINPDIFGSMIQAVAEDDERGELGMHYTSVPNILKVLNPLFLDDLREQLNEAGDSRQKLRNLRKRLANIRVFDPACGSGNFLVIAYKEMRAIEAEIVNRLGGEANLKLEDRRSVIPLANFYGIEIKGFAAEIARLALLIAEFQSDCLYLSQQEARAMVLPLHRTGQITTGNALRVDWTTVCPSFAKEILAEHDLAGPTGRLQLEQSGLPEAAAVETFICGNPPYKGSQGQSEEQKDDLRTAFKGTEAVTGSADYVLGWFAKATRYVRRSSGAFAFVTTNSVHQGRQVGRFWPALLSSDLEIFFAEPSFKWTNLAANKAVVTVSIIGVARRGRFKKLIFDGGLSRQASYIGPYLVPDVDAVVDERREPMSHLPAMSFGSMPNDGGHLILSFEEAVEAASLSVTSRRIIRPFVGTNELTKGLQRYCIWLPDGPKAPLGDDILRRIDAVALQRKRSTRGTTSKLADTPFRFGEVRQNGDERVVLIGGVSSESREYLPVALMPEGTIVSNLAFFQADVDLWNLALIASRLHLVWIATVCGKLETRYRYSNTLGWNTFPIPKLTEQNKADLTRTAENILLAREAHFPATITDLYDPERMDSDFADLRRAHQENDEVLERIYIGRRFRNDTERLEKLFELYTKMTAEQPQAKKGRKAA